MLKKLKYILQHGFWPKSILNNIIILSELTYSETFFSYNMILSLYIIPSTFISLLKMLLKILLTIQYVLILYHCYKIK